MNVHNEAMLWIKEPWNGHSQCIQVNDGDVKLLNEKSREERNPKRMNKEC